MNQEQTYNNCENFEVEGKCLLIGEEVTKQFIGVNMVDEEGNNEFSTTEEANKKCSTCTSFKKRGS